MLIFALKLSKEKGTQTPRRRESVEKCFFRMMTTTMLWVRCTFNNISAALCVSYFVPEGFVKTPSKLKGEKRSEKEVPQCLLSEKTRANKKVKRRSGGRKKLHKAPERREISFNAASNG